MPNTQAIFERTNVAERILGVALLLLILLLGVHLCTHAGGGAFMAEQERACAEAVLDGPQGPVFVTTCD